MWTSTRPQQSSTFFDHLALKSLPMKIWHKISQCWKSQLYVRRPREQDSSGGPTHSRTICSTDELVFRILLHRWNESRHFLGERFVILFLICRPHWIIYDVYYVCRQNIVWAPLDVSTNETTWKVLLTFFRAYSSFSSGNYKNCLSTAMRNGMEVTKSSNSNIIWSQLDESIIFRQNIVRLKQVCWLLTMNEYINLMSCLISMI